MARMRYAQQALDLIREEDPGTSISVHFIRALAASGKIPVCEIGRRKLINVDALLEYLAGSDTSTESANQIGTIRRVKER